MKHLYVFVTILLFAGIATAEPFTVQFSSVSCQTNSSATVTNAPDNNMPLSGFVYSVIYDQTGTGTGTLSIVTVSGYGTGASRTILLNTNVSSDAVWPVRNLVCTTLGVDISNTPASIPLVADHIEATLYGWGATNNSAKIYVVITPEQ